MASPESSLVHYVRVRPVPRLEDQSVVSIHPVTVDPRTTETIRKVDILLTRKNLTSKLHPPSSHPVHI